MDYTDARTWFYGLICGGCDLVFYEEPHEDVENMMPCPRCGQLHPETEPTMAQAEVVLSRKGNPDLHQTMIDKAEAMIAAAPDRY